MKYHCVYDTTWEQVDTCDNVTGSIELRFTYTYTKGCDDWYDRIIGAWMPGDSPEMEIIKIEEEIFIGGKPEWQKITDNERFEYFEEWAIENCVDKMVKEAVETINDRGM